MTTLQEIVDLADAMQLRAEERKAFIAEEMVKLRNLQAEEKAARLQAEERAARLQAEERAARLQAEERERETRLQAEERERETRLQAEERLKIEELKAQVEIEKIRAQASAKTTGGAAEGTTGQVRPKLPRLPAFVDGKDDLD